MRWRENCRTHVVTLTAVLRSENTLRGFWYGGWITGAPHGSPVSLLITNQEESRCENTPD